MLLRLTLEVDTENKTMLKLLRKFLTKVCVLHSKPPHAELAKIMPGMKFGSKLRLVPRPQAESITMAPTATKVTPATTVIPTVIPVATKPVRITVPVERSMPLPADMEQL